MEPDFLRVGTCSLAAIPGEIDENLEKIKEWIVKAISEKIDLLLFPELSLSGYWWNTELLYTAQPRDGPAIQELIKFLKEKQTEMVISVGLAESYGGCIYNTQIALTRTVSFPPIEKLIGRMPRWERGAAEIDTIPSN